MRAEKSAGAWMDGIVGQSELLAAPGEKMRLPVAIIVCNQSPPVGSQPPLMTMECVPMTSFPFFLVRL